MTLRTLFLSALSVGVLSSSCSWIRQVPDPELAIGQVPPEYQESLEPNYFERTLVGGSTDQYFKDLSADQQRLLSADRVILAPGIAFDPVPGQSNPDLMPHAWKAGPQTSLLARQLAAMPSNGVAVLTIPKAPYRCPPECGRPPIGEPVETNPRYTADDGAFSVNHPGEGSAYRATYNANGIVLRYVGGDTGTLVLFGEPAQNRPPQDIAQALIEEKYPNATVAYEIPNASVGYQPGYGVAADEYPQNSTGKYARLRIIVLVAVKHDYALIAAAVGPYRRFTPDYGSGHPSPANLELARDMGKYVNSFRWRGDLEVGGS